MMATEIAINHLIHKTGIDPVVFRQLNFYSNGDKTHFGQTLEGFYVPKLWKEIIDKSDYKLRQEALESFNSQNRWKKRGLTLIPTKFGINFTAKFMNQGGALVHVYTDGNYNLFYPFQS